MKVFCILFFVIVITITNAQQYRNPVIDQGRVVYGLSTRPPELIGSGYLSDEWKTADIFLKPKMLNIDTLRQVSIKYHIAQYLIEILHNKEVKILKGGQVEGFQFTDEGERALFINCSSFKPNDKVGDGFCELLSSEGKLMLVKTFYTEIIKANYNVALDVGNKDDTIVNKERLFFVYNNELMPVSKKMFLSLTEDKEQAVKEFLKDSKVNLNKENDLIRAVNFYNIGS